MNNSKLSGLWEVIWFYLEIKCCHPDESQDLVTFLGEAENCIPAFSALPPSMAVVEVFKSYATGNADIKKPGISQVSFMWHPVGESNPCYRRERAVS